MPDGNHRPPPVVRPVKTWRACLFLIGLLFLAGIGSAKAGLWASVATDTVIETTVIEPDPPVSPPALMVYLQNLSCDRIGQEPDESIIADFTAGGCRVVVLDYAGHDRASSPFLNADVLRIRQQIGAGVFPGSTGLNEHKNQCYILHEGYRLLRNVPYYLNDPEVYAGSDSNATLRMDIAYPSQPDRPVPVVMEFSTSNSYDGNEDDRMRNDYAFTGTADTILEGAPAAGIAWAMADHPKYRSWGSPKLYSGFEVNPDTIRKVRSAVRVLREVGATVGLSGNIFIHGFSRGATAGSLAIGDRADPAIDSAGYSTALASRVQAVLLGSGLYDYSHAGGTITGDPPGTEVDIYNRFVIAWGSTASNLPLWERQGALAYMTTKASAPVFLSYNTDDGTYYPYQAQLLEAKLASLGVPHQVVTGTGGHKVTTSPSTLTAIYDFFNAHTNPVPQQPEIQIVGNPDRTQRTVDVIIGTTSDNDSLLYAIHTDHRPTKWVQVDGRAGPDPVWRPLDAWGSLVRVQLQSPLDACRLALVTYDPTLFTTARSDKAGLQP